jgi:hypothetical protein
MTRIAKILLLTLAAIIAAAILSFPGRGLSRMWKFNRTVTAAFNGKIDPSDTTNYAWACGPDCGDWLIKLPPVSHVECSWEQKPDGACCVVVFGDHLKSEVHIFRLGDGRYRVEPRYPECRLPDSDSSADYWEAKWVRCEEIDG